MTILETLKQKLAPRFPRLAILAALLVPGGYTAYQTIAIAGDCCDPECPFCAKTQTAQR